MTQGNTRKTMTTTGAQTQNVEEQIRHRAYELYEARGREDGHDLNDWLRAEKEITQQKTRTIAALNSAPKFANHKRAPGPSEAF